MLSVYVCACMYVCVSVTLPLFLPCPSLSLSPHPSNFFTLTSRSGNVVEKPLEDTNVGHQMLKKMGWEGAGLGAEEQGIQEPVKGGEVRDKVDKYKVGVVTKRK